MADVEVSIQEPRHQSHTCSHRCFFTVSGSFFFSYVILYMRVKSETWVLFLLIIQSDYFMTNYSLFQESFKFLKIFLLYNLQSK